MNAAVYPWKLLLNIETDAHGFILATIIFLFLEKMIASLLILWMVAAVDGSRWKPRFHMTSPLNWIVPLTPEYARALISDRTIHVLCILTRTLDSTRLSTSMRMRQYGKHRSYGRNNIHLTL